MFMKKKRILELERDVTRYTHCFVFESFLYIEVLFPLCINDDVTSVAKKLSDCISIRGEKNGPICFGLENKTRYCVIIIANMR